ncbi:MAG: sugar ABC transporter ATP-binding protein [Bauldia sp.]|nr:sugar ABC transporter ATP-binding protein [Bauldia sp.]
MGQEDVPYVIEATDIVKNFAGVQALRGVDFRVRRGEIHALLGQNGAGKSTLVKILNGVHAAGTFDGTIRVDGTPVSFATPGEAQAHGVAYVPQETEVFEQLTVAENVFAGRTNLGKGMMISQRALRERTAELFRDFGLSLDPGALVATLTAAQRHLVMIVRALTSRPLVLMLDEPTASLSGSEVALLFGLLKRLKAAGTTMIFITHRLPEVIALCDRATVLRDGRVAAELDRDSFDEEQIITAMSGERMNRLYPHHDAPTDATTLLEVEGLSVEERYGFHLGVHDVNFTLRAGEILGIAGLLGSGRSELLGALYGRLPHRGRLAIEGREVAIRSVHDARDAGIALLTEDRKGSGLLFNLPVGSNITIGNLALFASHGMVRGKSEDSAILKAMRELKVRARSPAAAVSHLSGGNQQKLLFARVLMNAPKILLLDEPTKGVDVATRHEIYKLIVDLADRGVGLIVVSSELEEVIGLCDRILVFDDGRIVEELARSEATEDRVLRLIAGHQARKTAAVVDPVAPA